MRIVHHSGEVLPERDTLHAARHVDFREPALDRPGRHPGGVQDPDRQQCVSHVERAGQAQPDVQLEAVGAVRGEGLLAGGERLHVGGGPTRLALGGHRDGVLLDQPTAPLAVDADDLVLGAAVEQQRLGLEVVLKIAVKVQVVLGQVGERADGEPGTGDPAHGQRVAGDLHRHVGHPLLDHHGQQRLQVGGLGRGERAVQPFAGDAGLDGADQSGAEPGRLQRRLQQVGGGGLAGGAGHTEHLQPPRRVAVDQGRCRAEHAAWIVVHQQRDLAFAHGRVLGQRGAIDPGLVREHRDGTGFQRVFGEVGTVHARSRQSGEEIAGAHVLSTQGRPGHRRCGSAGTRDAKHTRADDVGELLDLHRLDTGRARRSCCNRGRHVATGYPYHLRKHPHGRQAVRPTTG